jgi:hypothetical protein
MNEQYKEADIVEYAGIDSEAYVLNVNIDQIRLLFFDGSCGWYNIDAAHLKLTAKKWSKKKLQNTIKLGFFKWDRTKTSSYIDNLTYIEILAKVKGI